MGIHPLKFTFGLLRKARELGVKVHPASPVQGWTTVNGVHHLQTPGGTVRAKRVVVCTGGYTGQKLTPMLKNKILPILSNSLVTRPLTAAEMTACRFTSKTFMTDTRTLRFYYRLLEGNRLQLGSRSSITGADAASSTWAGKRIAERVAGKDAGQEVFKLPIYSTPLEYPNVWNMVRSEAFAPFRRFGQFFLYKWYWLQDEKI